MRSYFISPIDEGEKLISYLKKAMPNAPTSFFHKMLRKKNIVLNGKKGNGAEILSKDDEIKLFLSDETINKFALNNDGNVKAELKAAPDGYRLSVVFENKHICIVDKPIGLLTQKSKQSDFSLNELFCDYLLKKGEYDPKLSVFRPSACNRIDRNTSGLVIMAKTKNGAKLISQMLRDRAIKKFYQLVVMGEFGDKITIVTQFKKDEGANKVYINSEEGNKAIFKGDEMSSTFTPLFTARLCRRIPYWEKKEGGVRVTVMEAQIHTGKPHQIRAQMAHMGYPIVGDIKYTKDTEFLRIYKEYGIGRQLLRAIRLEFADIEDEVLDGIGEAVCIKASSLN